MISLVLKMKLGVPLIPVSESWAKRKFPEYNFLRRLCSDLNHRENAFRFV